MSDTSRASSLESLPTEILIQIIEYVAYYGGAQRREAILEAYNPRIPSWMGLQSLRLCSRRLRILATPVLFRRIRLHQGIDSAALQALPLSASPLSRHVRNLIISSSCAMPSESIERFVEEFNYRLDLPGASQLFNMREADKGTFPTLLLGLFRAVRDRLTSLKIHVADVIPMHNTQMKDEYPTLFIRTLSFALRNIGLPQLKKLSLVHHHLGSPYSFGSELAALNMVPAQSIFPRSFSEGTWVTAADDPCPSLKNVKFLKMKMDNRNKRPINSPMILSHELPEGVEDGTIKVEDLSLVKIFNKSPDDPGGSVHFFISFPFESLKSLRMLGFFDLLDSSALEETLNNCPNLSYLHLRGIFISSRGWQVDPSEYGPLNWARFFDACAVKESLLNVRFEVLSSLPGNKMQRFWDEDDIRLPDNESDAQRKTTIHWNEELCFWNPMISGSEMEFNALENMTLSIIERRKKKGLKATRWLKLCRESYVVSARGTNFSVPPIPIEESEAT